MKTSQLAPSFKIQEQNKKIVIEIFSAIDDNNLEKLHSLLSEDFTLNAPGLPEPWNEEDVFQAIKSHYTSFPDWKHDIEELIAEDDKIAVKLMQHGIQKKSYEGIEPNGKQISKAAVSVMTILDGKVKDWWVMEDELGFMQQLGMELKPKTD